MTLDAIPFDLGWMMTAGRAWSLVLARVSGLCLTGPTTAIPGVDLRFRLLLAIALGAVMAPVIGHTTLPHPAWTVFLGWLLMELLTGALLGWSAGLIVAAARQAGELVGAQAGLSTAALFDPETGLELTPLGHLYGLLALAVFLAMDGPLLLASALLESYQVIPMGTWVLNEQTVAKAFSQVGAALALAVRAAAPPAVALTLASVALGWIGRLASAVPLLTLSLPVRSMLGILLVFFSLGTLAVTLSQAWSHWPWGP